MTAAGPQPAPVTAPPGRLPARAHRRGAARRDARSRALPGPRAGAQMTHARNAAPRNSGTAKTRTAARPGQERKTPVNAHNSQPVTSVTSSPPAAPDVQAAEETLAALTAPLDGVRSARFPVIQLAAAPLARRRWRTAGWADAAAVHQQSLPSRVPAATLAAARRHLPAMAAGSGQQAWLYVPRCAGTGQHTWRCEAAGVLTPGGGLLAVLGEHSAADPAVAAASLAHEAGHQAGWTHRVLGVVRSARQAAGWGWAAAGLGGARFGWPGVLAAAAGFQAVSLLVMWTTEIACDRRAARAEGRAAVLHAFAFIAARQAARRAGWPRWQRAGQTVLAWAAGPAHPTAALRRVIVAATTRP